MFFCVATTHGPNWGQIWHAQRRIGIHRRVSSSNKHITSEVRNIARSATLARSLICNVDRLRPSPLLRVFHRTQTQYYYVPEYTYPLEDIFRLINSRHLVVPARLLKTGRLTPSFYHLWNLQTLQLDYVHIYPLLVDIWRMPRLRHVNIFKFHSANPPTSDCDSDSGVLWDLQTLKTILISNRVEEMVRKIPNLKKLNLKVPYTIYLSRVDYGLDSLCRLRKLESLCCNFYCTQDPVNHSHDLARGLVFPSSLRKMTLENSSLVWDDLAAKIGHLPHLQVLVLKWDSCKGPKWATVEGLFCSLKVLKIHSCSELVYWTMENWVHLPCLEHLVLNYLPNLKVIPLEIGNIPTMKSIELSHCSDSAVVSAEEIAKEQEELGNEGLRVRVVLRDKSQVLQRLGGLASANFRVEI